MVGALNAQGTYILHLTYSVCGRKVLVNRVRLTPFSAPLESTRSSEVNSHQPRSSRDDQSCRVYPPLNTATPIGRAVNGTEGWPGIVSRFQLVLLAGRRSKQLFQGARPRIPADPRKRRNTSIALEELRRGLVPFSQNGTKSQAIPSDLILAETRP
jgi:DNA-directed RNA polymerase omega subunit